MQIGNTPHSTLCSRDESKFNILPTPCGQRTLKDITAPIMNREDNCNEGGQLLIKNHHWAERRSVTRPIIYSWAVHTVTQWGSIATSHLQGFLIDPDGIEWCMFAPCEEFNHWENIFFTPYGSFLPKQCIWVGIYCMNTIIALLHLWNAGRKLQLLRKWLPVPINASGSVTMTWKHLRCLHNDGIQISNPVRVNTWQKRSLHKDTSHDKEKDTLQVN